MGRRALMWFPAVVLVAGTSALLPAGVRQRTHRQRTRATSSPWPRGSDTGNCRSGPAERSVTPSPSPPERSIVIRPGIYRSLATPTSSRRALRPQYRSAGSARTVIDATATPMASSSRRAGVGTGLIVKDANLEGIGGASAEFSAHGGASAPAISRVTIAGNPVVHNDRAYDTASRQTRPAPLAHRRRRLRRGHPPSGSARPRSSATKCPQRGGILMSDGGFGISVGPAAHNLIAYNRSSDNAFDCGSPCPATTPARWPRAVRRRPATAQPGRGV